MEADPQREFIVAAMRAIPALAASIGGLSWIIKASMILATGNQPPLLFEVAPVFFAVAVYGLLIYVVDPMGVLRIVAKAGIALVITAAAVGLALPNGPEGSALREALSSLVDVVSGFGILILLVGLGFPLMRQRLWEGYWRFLPLALGLGFIPALAVGIMLEAAFGERYLEIPFIVMGSGWVLLGYRLRPVASE